MEEFLKLTDDIYKQYERMESRTSQLFEQLLQSMEEMFKNTMNDLASDLSPTQNKKQTKRLSVVSDEEGSISSGREEVKTLRPVRTARLNALKTLKERSIKNKMRQPVVYLERLSNEENNKNFNNQTPKSIKQVKQSKDQLLLNNNDIKSEKLNSNNENVEKEIASQNIYAEISNKKLDDSVVIKASLNIKQEKLSQGELDLMPPPAIPEIKVKRTKKKKVATDAKSTTVVPIRNTRSRVKRELIEEQNETVSDAGNDDMGSQRKSAKVAAKDANKSMANSTIESIYEDANNGSNNMQAIIILKRCDLQVSSKIQESSKLDATFISSQFPANRTSQNNTVIVSSNSKDKNMQKQPSKCDETIFVASNLSSNACNELISTNSNEVLDKKQGITDETHSSVLNKNTSENKLIVEMAPPLLNLTKSKVPLFNATFIKSKNEIFNPFMQSPVKKKIEAFEQAAIDSMQCVTQTKTKAAVANQECISIPEEVKQTEIITNVEVKKKQGEKGITGCLLGTNLINKSSSKLAHIQKSLQMQQQKSSSSLALANSNSLTSLHTRENCVDDLKHAHAQTLDEKRRKREEKQRLALQLREAKNKEHREQTEKIIRERDERVKEKLLEKERRVQHGIQKKKILKEQVERRRQLEQINKNLRQQQQLQDKQQFEGELSENEYIEALKRENAAKDMIRLLQEKELLKLTLLKNKEKLAKEQELKKSNIVKYDFDILASEDSTDEEGKQTTKKPAPPAWSRSIVRKFLIEQQAYIPSKIIDSFFSIAPMSPDLLDIFPSINPKYLRRRSSAVWKTPPRYTLLPKY